MDPTNINHEDLAHDFPPFLKVHKDGRAERYRMFGPISLVPAGIDSATGVHTKDITVFPETGVTGRIFLPKIETPGQKLPLVVHYHGGGFCDGSPADSVYYNYLNALASRANVVVFSVGYRLAPESPLPAAYDDSLAALKWVTSGNVDPWLTEHADLGRVFLSGDSSGGNIAHYVAVQAGVLKIPQSQEAMGVGLKIRGLVILHPFFGSKDPGPNGLYLYFYPTSLRYHADPKLNPAVDPDLTKLVCSRVLVAIAERDWIREGGLAYYETLRNSGWKGKVEMEETKEEDHCFHLFKRNDNARYLLDKVAKFLNLNEDDA